MFELRNTSLFEQPPSQTLMNGGPCRICVGVSNRVMKCHVYKFKLFEKSIYEVEYRIA